jgi:hypothetical protein
VSETAGFSFLQVSDVHLGRPFGWLPPDRRAVRRAELRDLWRRIVAEAIARRADALLVAGDLFDGEEADLETVNRAIECVNVPGCPPVFIAPGNHDCYSKANLYYDNAKLAARGQAPWPSHVTLFTSPEMQPAPLAGHPAVRIWGRCVEANVDSDDRILRRVPPLAEDALHVLLLHGSREGFAQRPGKKITAPFSDEEALRSGFDYIALGHYHEPAAIADARGTVRAAYSGSPAALARDETGEHGALFVRLEVRLGPRDADRVRRVECEAVPVDTRRLLEVRVDLDGCGSPESARERLLAAIDAAGAGPRDLVRARCVGRTRPGVEVTPRPEDAGDRVWCLDVDGSGLRPDYDLERYRLGEPTTTEERFARSLLVEMEAETDPEARRLFEAALYYGLDALRTGQVTPRREWSEA